MWADGGDGACVCVMRLHEHVRSISLSRPWRVLECRGARRVSERKEKISVCHIWRNTPPPKMTASPPTAAATLRIAAAALLAAKKEAGDTAPTTRPAAADAGAVAAITLKAAVSALADAAEAARASASAACEAADAGGLALQTLLYEARHYDREIEACWAFR